MADTQKDASTGPRFDEVPIVDSAGGTKAELEAALSVSFAHYALRRIPTFSAETLAALQAQLPMVKIAQHRPKSLEPVHARPYQSLEAVVAAWKAENPETAPPLDAAIAEVLDNAVLDSMRRMNDVVLESMRRVQLARTTPVSQGDSDFLRDHAGLDDSSILDDWSAAEEDQRRTEVAAASGVQFVADTLSREDAAHALGIDETNISRRAKKGQLYAVYRDGRPRFPRWQFRDGAVLPGLTTIVECLDGLELDPVSVATFMVRPNDEFDDHSPVDYLAAGGDPDAVVALLDAWARI